MQEKLLQQEYEAKDEIEQFGKDIAKLKHHSAHGKAILLWRMGYRFINTRPIPTEGVKPFEQPEIESLKSCCKLSYAAGWWAGIDKYKENNPVSIKEGLRELDKNILADALKDSAQYALGVHGISFFTPEKWPDGVKDFWLELYDQMMRKCSTFGQPVAVQKEKGE